MLVTVALELQRTVARLPLAAVAAVPVLELVATAVMAQMVVLVQRRLTMLLRQLRGGLLVSVLVPSKLSAPTQRYTPTAVAAVPADKVELKIPAAAVATRRLVSAAAAAVLAAAAAGLALGVGCLGAAAGRCLVTGHLVPMV